MRRKPKVEEFATEEHDTVDSKKYGKPRQYDPNFKGPIHDRSCTDIICCILFIIFILGMVICSIFGYVRGNPAKLLYPTDSQGKICGMGDLKDKPYLFFFDLLQCAKMGPAVVVSGCPTPQVCVENCPSSNFVYLEAALNPSNKNKLICKYNTDLSNVNNAKGIEDLVKKDVCAAYYVNSSSVVGRCIPSIFKKLGNMATSLIADDGTELRNAAGEILTGTSLANGTRYLAEFYKFKEWGELLFKDVVATWHFILIGLAIAMVICLLWIFLLRWIVGVMVWVTLIAFLALFAVSTWYSYTKYYELKSANVTQEFGLAEAFALNFRHYLSLKQTWLAFGCTSATLLVIFLLIIIFLASRICIAIELIKEGSKAIGNMMFTLLWPIIPFILQMIVVAYWVSTAIYIASMGEAEYFGNETNSTGDIITDVTERIPCDPKANGTAGKICEFVKYGGNQYTIFMQLYMLFMFFWLMNFVVALGQMTLAGAFASYYWAFEKPRDIPAFPLGSSFWRSIRYHLGSMAFGSLIIAIVQFIRAFLEYLDRKLKGSENKVARFFLKCLKCCFWCLENILKFINKNAYIMIAVYGKNFCTAAKDGFLLIMRNIVRTVVLDKVSDFILFIGKLMVTAAIGVSSYFWFQGEIPVFKNYIPALNFYLTPVIILVIGTYLISCSFFSVYNMAVDTLFLCFLEDLERNDGSTEKPYFMSKGLRKILKKSNKKPEKREEEM